MANNHDRTEVQCARSIAAQMRAVADLAEVFQHTDDRQGYRACRRAARALAEIARCVGVEHETARLLQEVAHAAH